MKHLIFLLMVLSLLVAGTGCGLVQTIAYGPYGPVGTMCGASGCGDTGCGTVGCGVARGPVGCGVGSRALGVARGVAHGVARGVTGVARGVACNSGCGGTCGVAGGCGGGACGVAGGGCGVAGGACGVAGGACGVAGGGCAPCGPLAWIFGLFHPGTYWGASCGETYWGDFHSNPPDCQDPCDSCGNWTGSSTSTGSTCSSCGVASQSWSSGYIATSRQRQRSRMVAQPNRASQPSLQAVRPASRRYY